MQSNTSYLSVSLNQMVDLMRIKAEFILKNNFKIDYSQFLILHAINCFQTTNQQMISKTINLTGAGVSKQIDKLEAAKLIMKIMDKNNRRANLITLTPKGQKLINQALISLETEFGTYITSKDKKTMFIITKQVIKNLLKN